jgi:tRNA threonylcarbamoyladenosine biosynthesis protein TsaE
MEIEIISNGVNETISIGVFLGKLLVPKDIVALIGELGSGKTYFIKGIAKGLEVKEEVKSPTYVIISEHKGRIPLYHFDLYRISSIYELEELDYREYFYGTGVTVIEWADKFPDIIPVNAFKVEILNIGEYRRKLILDGNEDIVTKIIPSLCVGFR